MNYKNKVVWVTGASSGIGLELAKQLDKLGANLVLSARNEAVLRDFVQSCQTPENHHVLTFDLLDSEAFTDIEAKARNAFGRIDVLVNNGGISQRSLVMETALEVDRKVMEVDYFAAVALTKAVLPKMVEQGGGLIVNIASVAGKIGSPMRSAYAGAKHALIGFMDCLRAEVSQFGIRVVNICPGFVQTNISRNALTGDSQAYNRLDSEIATGMPVDAFVKKMLKSLEGNSDEIIIAKGKPKLGYQLRRLLPNLYHRILPKIYQRES